MNIFEIESRVDAKMKSVRCIDIVMSIPSSCRISTDALWSALRLPYDSRWVFLTRRMVWCVSRNLRRQASNCFVEDCNIITVIVLCCLKLLCVMCQNKAETNHFISKNSSVLAGCVLAKQNYYVWCASDWKNAPKQKTTEMEFFFDDLRCRKVLISKQKYLLFTELFRRV